MKYCPNCKGDMFDRDAVCPHCGYDFRRSRIRPPAQRHRLLRLGRDRLDGRGGGGSFLPALRRRLVLAIFQGELSAGCLSHRSASSSRWPCSWCSQVESFRTGESTNVAFRSAKVAAFAERKATKSEVTVSLILSGPRTIRGGGGIIVIEAGHVNKTSPWKGALR